MFLICLALDAFVERMDSEVRGSPQRGLKPFFRNLTDGFVLVQRRVSVSGIESHLVRSEAAAQSGPGLCVFLSCKPIV